MNEESYLNFKNMNENYHEISTICHDKIMIT